MTNIFSIIDGLTVTSEDILEAELFSEQYLSSAFPTYDFRQGTALRDMTVRPNATLLALVNKAIKYYFDETDIKNITNSTDPEIVDSKLSNFFISRRSGDKSVIRARLYFSFPNSSPISTVIPTSAYFSTDNSTKFNPKSSVSINPDPGESLRIEGNYYFYFDSAEDLHYVDLDLVSEAASSDADISEGDLLYFTIFSPYFLSGKIQYLVSSAIETETNLDMINRAESAISTRNLINAPSIKASVLSQFNYSKSVLTAGLGSPNMYRDLISLDQGGTIRQFHKGGHVDVYVDTSTVTQRVQFTLDDNGSFQVSGPVISMVRAVDAPDGKDADTVPPNENFLYYGDNVSTYVDGVPDTPELDLGLSTKQLTRVEVPLASVNETITMDITSFFGLNSIQSAITSEEQRVVCADYLVRAFEPVYIDIEVDMRSSVNTDEAVKDLEDYIKSIPNGGVIYMASIISIIQAAGVTNFMMPITARATAHSKYINYKSNDPMITDREVSLFTDTFSLRETQMFQIGNIIFRE
jgi:hypothetical protein